ncbi:glycosyltransferase family 9 protein [Danxiaibacter flavus]|uniref:Glycosyltransferase family 9 protein n=1 Tax=Danxiaibacter flavus TaxID=3049108 RepID=A0ABV3ZGG4_9BACT|nr:glycosyltransferase family 9 protein [Chitinophagaceae bacterium DXS]
MNKRFLVIQTAFIGDVILATGVLEKLHAFYPEAEIDYMVRKGNESMLKNHPYIRNVLVWNKKENKYGNLLKLLKQIREAKYDKVINVQRFAATGFITAFSNAKEKIGFDKNPWSFAFTKKVKHIVSNVSDPHIFHEIERNNKLIEDFTDDKPAKPRLYPTKEDYSSVEQYKQQPYICIAPASVWFTKQYPPEKWISFIKKLPDNLLVYLVGAPNDSDLCNIIKDATGGNVINLAGKLDFLQSCALFKDARMNYVNDSAPMHLASSVNAPVTAVYCSTINAFGFGPLSDKRFVVETKINLSCRPCGLHGHASCPEGHFKCALTIEDQQLLNSIDN